MNKSIVITAVVSAAVGGVLGGTITYLTVNKTLRTRYEDWANSEIDEAKARYARMNAEGKKSILEMAENPSPEVLAAVQKGKEMLEKLGYSPAEESVEESHPTARTLSIFDQGVDDPEEEEESEFDEAYLTQMDKGYEPIEGQPYLISEAEYFENEPEYELDTLTYYELDHTLTDEKNTQIDRVEETIGERHLHMFQKNGTEKTSLYIRNDEHDTLYEVILVEKSYAALILGMDEEELGLKEPKQRPKKMKRDDD